MEGLSIERLVRRASVILSVALCVLFLLATASLPNGFLSQRFASRFLHPQRCDRPHPPSSLLPSAICDNRNMELSIFRACSLLLSDFCTQKYVIVLPCLLAFSLSNLPQRFLHPETCTRPPAIQHRIESTQMSLPSFTPALNLAMLPDEGPHSSSSVSRRHRSIILRRGWIRDFLDDDDNAAGAVACGPLGSRKRIAHIAGFRISAEHCL